MSGRVGEARSHYLYHIMQCSDYCNHRRQIDTENLIQIVIVERFCVYHICKFDIAIFSDIVDDCTHKLLLLRVQQVSAEIFTEFHIDGFLT